jgi:hypothetical protein
MDVAGLQVGQQNFNNNDLPNINQRFGNIEVALARIYDRLQENENRQQAIFNHLHEESSKKIDQLKKRFETLTERLSQKGMYVRDI